MKCEFSETQFVFGVMNELVNNYLQKKSGWTALYFPTQRKEMRLGYDVKIKNPVRTRSVFFQFKVPEKKTTSKGKYWTQFGQPYYEFKIWPDNVTHQHNELVNLAKSPHNKVYYCSPGFHTFNEFDINYQYKKIAKNSIYVPCKGLPTISENVKHNIAYTLKPKVIAKMHSEEFSIDAFDIGQLVEDIDNTEAYVSVHECLIYIAEMFSIEISDRSNDENIYHEIANYLVENKNLFLLLVSDC